jgi:hypothetical protein
MAADFSQLYSQLGLGPDCSLEEFRHACRRRIADLHPDRADADTVADVTQIPLDELLVLYAKAIRFHGQHGRLPGAAPVHHPPPAAVAPAVPVQLIVPLPAIEPVAGAGGDASAAATSAVVRSSPRGPLIVLLLVAIVLIALTAREETTQAAGGDVQAATPVESQDDAAPVVETLEIGMDPESVLAIQGEPMRYNEWEWEYGPSWLRFEDGQLVDWYSSPLHPLKTATASPQGE